MIIKRRKNNEQQWLEKEEEEKTEKNNMRVRCMHIHIRHHIFSQLGPTCTHPCKKAGNMGHWLLTNLIVVST